MSVGALGNRSQPDDFMAYMLYTIFNQPDVSLRFVQKSGLCVLLVQVFYIVFLKDKTMIPFYIVNFMVCSLFVHMMLLYD